MFQFTFQLQPEWSLLTRDEILDEYYAKYFTALCNSGAQGWGSRKFHKNIEGNWKNGTPRRILEVGAGTGEHFAYLQSINPEVIQEYIALDIRAKVNSEVANLPEGLVPVKWVSASVQDIPFADSYFDRAIISCLLHHLEDPYLALLELRRIVANNGEIFIGMPADPGIANQMHKKLHTYRKARKIGIENPKFIYSLEHRNHLIGLLSILQEVFKNDKIVLSYWPFKLANWHLNLSVNVNIIVSK